MPEFNYTGLRITENVIINADFKAGKSVELDIRSKLPNGIQINIEMQNQKQESFKKRVDYYSSKAYDYELMEKDRYNKLKKIISFNIIDFNIREGSNQFFHVNRERWDEDMTEVDDSKIECYLELNTYNKLEKNKDYLGNTQDQWVALFNKDTPKKVIDIIINNNSAIKKACGRYKMVLNTPEMMEAAIAREKAQRDKITLVDEAEK